MKINVLLASMLLAVAAAPAIAQVPGAIGQPLKSADLPPGTITVKVVAGKVQNVVAGTDVTLLVNGTPRVARTDTGGHAAFPGLPVGATVQAKVLDEDKKEITSAEFQVADDQGIRVMLSTKPFQAMGAGEAPFAGGGGAGMPDPRQLSGEPRAEATDAPGTMTVRLTYDNLLEKKNLDKLPVFLTGYKSDDSVTVYKVLTDAEGRAVFDNLDRTGGTSYFASAQMPRGEIVDRLASSPAVLDSRAGIRMMLSADKLDSKSPAIDDLSRIDKQDTAPKDPNQVRITLVGVPEETSPVTLVAYGPGGKQRVIAAKPPTRAAPDPADVSAKENFKNEPDAPPNTLHVQVHGGGPDDNKPLGGVSIRLVPADAVKDPNADLSKIGSEQKTPDSGFFDITDSTKGKLVAHITINGKEMDSEPFDHRQAGRPARCRSALGYDRQARRGLRCLVGHRRRSARGAGRDVQQQDAVPHDPVPEGAGPRVARDVVHLSADPVLVQPDVADRRRVPRGRRQVRRHELLVGAVRGERRRHGHSAAEELQRRARRRTRSGRGRGRAGRGLPDR
ncbi:MAG: hypothetical protein QM831_35250 [Kofleriaceae bacterium]